MNPLGLTFTLSDRSTPSRLVFQTFVGGVEFDDSAPSDFTFTYIAAPGENMFHLVVRFKVDQWDEYDLTFVNGNQGTAVHREFRKSKLNRTSAGSFVVTRTTP